MSTIVIPEKQYETLRKQASLYREVFSGVRRNFVEQYSDGRVEEFLKEDKIHKALKEKIKKFLK